MSYALGVFDAKKEEEKERKALRDHFAGLAMQGLIAEGPCGSMESVAYDSYRMADAMLAEREKGDE